MTQSDREFVLTRIGPDGLQFVYETERLPGYAAFTARWSLEAHHLACARPDTRYLVGGLVGEAPVGFVILQPVADVHEGAKIKRIAVASPGQGWGRRLVSATLRWVFTQTAAHRVWLDVFVHNTRAMAAYKANGMTVDGVLRSAYELTPGHYADRHLMSILRSEWQRQEGP